MTEFGDSVYEGGDDDGVDLDPTEMLTGNDNDEPFDTSYSPPEREPKATRYGTTELEEFEGESLDQRLAEEVPDVDESDVADEDEAPRAGRLVAPDEGAHADDEADEVAFDAGTAGYAASAEEAAIHVIDEE